MKLTFNGGGHSRRGCPAAGAAGWPLVAGVVASPGTQCHRNARIQLKVTEDRASRNIASFQPSIWGDFFLTHSSPLATSPHQQAWMVHRAEQLKEQVGKLIAISSTCSLYQRIHLIDVLERLCLNHLFEEEINDVLYQMNNIDVSGCDLQTVAMWFYLLRKHGYRVSPAPPYGVHKRLGDLNLACSSNRTTRRHGSSPPLLLADVDSQVVRFILSHRSSLHRYASFAFAHIMDELSLAATIDEDNESKMAPWSPRARDWGSMVADVFANFREEQGSFAANNPRDLLSLYNAASLRIHGEIILDEAISFTKKCLESIMPWMDASLASEIKCALEIPLPRSVRIYEAKSHMSEYGKEAEANELIMELAKLNYNLVQLQYQEELKIITRWWNGLELRSTLSFARDRVVECYFWIVGVYFEPSYSRARIILSKVLALVSILDDTYDVYGTSQECELFTKCVESWNPAVATGLPQNMRFLFGKLLDTCQSIEDDLAPEEKYRMPYLKNFIADLVRAYNKEVQWREQGYVPSTVEEHLQVSARSGACHLLSCTSFVGMGDVATEESFEWVCSVPKIVQALCIILRLSDDLKSYEREKMTSHVASTIDSCMKEHKVPVQEARVLIEDMIDETWKVFNEEWLNMKNHQPKELLERIFNLTRTMVYMYKQDDGYTNCHVIKDTIWSLFVEPVSIM
ncbi:hypothetical protein U9M48_037104 [Paspalum notatum var. saurae]|uniref:Uncharacterized protein n=1 Tax=Paspalum notatum var. saurae TaxID=547442 RepID=A0AAQ3UFR2_PASNO